MAIAAPTVVGPPPLAWLVMFSAVDFTVPPSISRVPERISIPVSPLTVASSDMVRVPSWG